MIEKILLIILIAILVPSFGFGLSVMSRDMGRRVQSHPRHPPGYRNKNSKK